MHHHDADCFMHTFLLCYSVQWYAYHAYLCHSLAFYASIHACLHVHAWVLLASVSSMLQHNEAMDIRSKPTFVPRGQHLLFAFFACLSSFLFACLPICFLAFLFIRSSCGLSCLLDISQDVMFSNFRGLAFPIWLCTLLNPLSSSLISLLDGLY